MWLSIDSVNRFKSIYLKGFLDISGGDLITRNGRLFVSSDASMNGGLYVAGNSIFGGDASMNSNMFLAGDASFND